MDKRNVFELRSRRIFIDEPLTKAATNTKDKAVGILTYFVNELRFGDKSTPYSIVTAISNSADSNSAIPMDIEDDEIIINQWLADDLGAKAGDSLELTYFVVSPMRKLDQETTTFKIRRILPMQGPAIDPDLMPDFPGLADADNCRDWDKGIPIDLDRQDTQSRRGLLGQVQGHTEGLYYAQGRPGCMGQQVWKPDSSTLPTN